MSLRSAVTFSFRQMLREVETWGIAWPHGIADQRCVFCPAEESSSVLAFLGTDRGLSIAAGAAVRARDYYIMAGKELCNLCIFVQAFVCLCVSLSVWFVAIYRALCPSIASGSNGVGWSVITDCTPLLIRNRALQGLFTAATAISSETREIRSRASAVRKPSFTCSI